MINWSISITTCHFNLEFIFCNDTGFIYMNNDLSEYHQDFYAWSKHNANLLRQGKLSEIDVLNIAEELDNMGISQLRALESRLTILLAHLLKWQFNPNDKHRVGNTLSLSNVSKSRRF